MRAMESYSLGATGLPATPVGFGGAPFAVLGIPASASDSLLGALLDLGVALVDTAACYADSEEAIGRAIGARRDEYTLVSKCGHKVGDATNPVHVAANIAAAQMGVLPAALVEAIRAAFARGEQGDSAEWLAQR